MDEPTQTTGPHVVTSRAPDQRDVLRGPTRIVIPAPAVAERVAHRPRSLATRTAVLLRPALAPVTVYLAGQALTLGMLGWLCLVRGQNLIRRLTSWDAQHFLRIAANGYTWSASKGTMASPAFLPGYPALIAAAHDVTGLSFAASAVCLSWVSGAIFACAIPQLVGHIPGANSSTGLVLVALVAVSPMSIVLGMAYSEALFCALTSWALVFALRHRWSVAGLLALLAGLVRISGLALAVAFAAVAIVALVRGRRQGRPLSAALRPGLAAVAAGAGTIGWIVGSGLRMGSVTSWFSAENSGWNSHWDFGVATLRFLYRMTTTAPSVYDVVTAAAVIGAAILVVCSILLRQPLMLMAYGVAVFAEVVGSAGIMNSRVRLLLPAFTLLAPIAALLSRLRTSVTVAALIGIALAGSWFSAYSLVIWKHAI